MTAKDIIVAMQTDSSNYYYKGSTIKPVGIVVHSTGANNPTARRYVNSPEQLGKNPNGNWFGSPGGAGGDPTALPHGVIGLGKDDKTVVVCQILPWTAQCQGCGSGKYGSYNKLNNGTGYIQFEICEDKLADANYFNKAFDKAAEFCAYLISLYPDIKLENIVSHKEANARGYASAHGDPENWLSKFGKDMNWFRDKVKSYTTGSANSNASSSTAKVVYANLSDVVGTTDASVTTIFREKGDNLWSSGWHNGTDIAAPTNTPIKAVADGTVVDTSAMAARQDNFGNRVIIEHADGVFSVYAHMIAPASVKKGDKVKRGQIIGRVGGTGKTQNQYGNHLHLTLLKGFKPSLYNIFYTNNELLDPIKVCGMGTLKFSSLAKSTIVENGVTKDLGDLNKYYGVSAASSTVKPAAAAALKVGDIVNFTGTTHYVGSTATRGTACKPGKAKITRIASGTAHPYHLVNDGGGCTVYGWVDEKDVH